MVKSYFFAYKALKLRLIFGKFFYYFNAIIAVLFYQVWKQLSMVHNNSNKEGHLKTFILIYLLVGIGLTVIAYFVIRDQKNAHLEDEKYDLIEIADFRIKQINFLFNEVNIDAQFIYQDRLLAREIKTYLLNKDQLIKRDLINWIKSLKNNGHYYDISLVRPDGINILTDNEKSIKLNKELKSYFDKTINEQIPNSSDIFVDEQNKLQKTIFIPLLDKTENKARVIAVIIAKVNLERSLPTILAKWPKYYNSSCSYLVRAKNDTTIFISTNKDTNNNKIAVIKIPTAELKKNIQKYIQSIGSVIESVDYKNKEIYATAKKVLYSEWLLVTKVDQSELSSFYKHVTFTTLFVYLLVLLLTGIVIWLILAKKDKQQYKILYETELKNKELSKRLNYIIDNANDIWLLMDANGKIVDANETALKKYGYTKTEILDLNINEIRTEETTNTIQRTLKNLKIDEGFIIEAEHKIKNGDIIQVEISGRLILLDGEKFYQSIIRDVTKRNIARNKINLQADMLDAVGQAVIATDTEGKIIYWNKTAELIYGWRFEEVKGQDIMEISPASSTVDQAKDIMEILRKGKSWIGEFEVKRKDGSVFPVIVSDSPIFDSKGKIIAIVGISTDISARKKAEEELRRSENKYKQLFHENLAGVFITKIDGTFLDCNPEFVNIVGYNSKEEVLKTNATNFYFDADRRKNVIVELKKTGILKNYEMKLKKKNGECIWLIGNVSLVDYEGQTEKVIQGSMLDQTEVKKIQEELKKSEEMFKTALSTMQEGFAILSSVRDDAGKTIDFKYEYINEAGCKLNMKLREEHLGHTMLELLPNHRGEIFNDYTRVVESNEPIIGREIFYKDIYGKRKLLERTFRFSASKLGDGIAISWRDITREKEDIRKKERLFKENLEANKRLQIISRQLLETQEKERRHIANELHDEIGQNLTALKFNLQTIKKISNTTLADTNLNRSIELIDYTINQIRNISLDLRPSILDDLGLGATISWLLERNTKWTSTNYKYDNSIKSRYPAELEITCFRIVQSAITNALKYAEANLITVEIWDDKEYLYTKITDDGKGFDVSKALHEAEKGKSIGLLSMRERAQLIGGKFIIKSNNEVGTEIFVILPIKSTKLN